MQAQWYIVKSRIATDLFAGIKKAIADSDQPKSESPLSAGTALPLPVLPLD